MIRLALAAGALALTLTSGAGAADRPGPYREIHRPRAVLPPHIPYRDPRYRPPPPGPRLVYGPPLAPVPIPARNLNAPLYNEPPPRLPFN